MSLQPSPLATFPSSQDSHVSSIPSPHSDVSILSDTLNKNSPSCQTLSVKVKIRSPNGSSPSKSLSHHAGVNVPSAGTHEGADHAASSNVTKTLGAFGSVYVLVVNNETIVPSGDSRSNEPSLA
jgi:hypothetical protein